MKNFILPTTAIVFVLMLAACEKQTADESDTGGDAATAGTAATEAPAEDSETPAAESGTAEAESETPPDEPDTPAAPPAGDDSFAHLPPGDLIDGSGTGYSDGYVFVEAMRFPIEAAPDFPNSQVYNPGGYQGPAGGQCDASNYDYPWRDNFCETRDYTTPLCPSGKGHQGQDIRPPACEKSKYWAVAAEAGTITAIGSYSVTLTADSGTIYRYLHVDMAQLPVAVGDHLARGARVGLVSNDFNDTPTTIHLHFEIKQNVALADGTATVTFVPPYSSLMQAYEALLNGAP